MFRKVHFVYKNNKELLDYFLQHKIIIDNNYFYIIKLSNEDKLDKEQFKNVQKIFKISSVIDFNSFVSIYCNLASLCQDIIDSLKQIDSFYQFTNTNNK